MWIDTASPPPLHRQQKHYLYNALDCIATVRIWEETRPKLDAEQELVYTFERAMRAPALEMMLRGLRVDHNTRLEINDELTVKRQRLAHILELYSHAVWGKPLNHNSPKQLAEFFYGVMNLPRQYKFDKGVKKVTTNRDALEKLWVYLYARPIVTTILALRDTDNKLSVVNKRLDSDGRFRFSLDPSGTETGRMASRASVFDTGSNSQNITDELRRMFIADPGMKIGYADLEQAESRGVGYLSGDEAYIEACLSGDLHTKVARLVWPTLPWTGDLKQDRKIADQIFYRWFTYRDMSKRGGHGTNYYGQPHTMAKHLKVHKQLMADFQEAYFKAFPGIPSWHNTTRSELQTTGFLVTPLGRKRFFLGRRYDDTTLREAIAYRPQSLIADILNIGLFRLWDSRIVQCLAQVHDAVLFQYDPRLEASVLPKVLQFLSVDVPINGRVMTIPTEVSVGWNWEKFNDDERKGPINLYGIKKWNGTDTRNPPPETSILDRRIR